MSFDSERDEKKSVEEEEDLDEYQSTTCVYCFAIHMTRIVRLRICILATSNWHWRVWDWQLQTLAVQKRLGLFFW